jgi:hypothetical protein
MNDPSFLSPLLYCYGTFLICCGASAYAFIGSKAKTALLSGGISGTAALFIAYLISLQTAGAQAAGVLLSLALFTVFSWRSAKTLFRIFELIPRASPELKGKGIAFLIISLMAVVSLFTCIQQIILF